MWNIRKKAKIKLNDIQNREIAICRGAMCKFVGRGFTPAAQPV